MFDKNQLTILTQELDSNRIKTREKGNINLSYIEGFDVIDTANKVFGFGNWSYSISKLDQVSQEVNQNQNNVVCYKAVVQIQIHNTNHTLDVNRQDVGFGTGVAKTLADAHEGAAKEAVTDAIKRCFRSFGNQFGNSLYDKTKNHQNQDSSYQNQQNHQQRQSYQNENVNSRATNPNFKSVGNQQQFRQNQTQNQTMQQQIQKPNNQQNNPPQQQSFKNNQSFDQFEYQPLYNLGLDVQEQNGFLIIIGENQYAYRDAIKACSFRFDAKSKTWYKQLEQRAS